MLLPQNTDNIGVAKGRYCFFHEETGEVVWEIEEVRRRTRGGGGGFYEQESSTTTYYDDRAGYGRYGGRGYGAAGLAAGAGVMYEGEKISMAPLYHIAVP